MPAWVVAIVSPFVKPALDWLYGKVMDWVTAYVRQRQAKAAIEEANRKVREQTESAQTKEERENAAQGMLDRF